MSGKNSLLSELERTTSENVAGKWPVTFLKSIDHIRGQEYDRASCSSECVGLQKLGQRNVTSCENLVISHSCALFGTLLIDFKTVVISFWQVLSEMGFLSILYPTKHNIKKHSGKSGDYVHARLTGLNVVHHTNTSIIY